MLNGLALARASRRPPHIVSDKAVRQRFGEMNAGDLFAVIEIGERARDAQHAVIAAGPTAASLRRRRE